MIFRQPLQKVKTPLLCHCVLASLANLAGSVSKEGQVFVKTLRTEGSPCFCKNRGGCRVLLYQCHHPQR